MRGVVYFTTVAGLATVVNMRDNMSMPNDPTPSTLGKLLKRLRQDAGLSLYEAGKRAGIDRARLLKLERGDIARVTPPVLNALARTFGVQPEELYDAIWSERPEELPSLQTYFRRKYRLSGDQIAEVERALDRARSKKNKKPKEGRSS